MKLDFNTILPQDHVTVLRNDLVPTTISPTTRIFKHELNVQFCCIIEDKLPSIATSTFYFTECTEIYKAKRNS